MWQTLLASLGAIKDGIKDKNIQVICSILLQIAGILGTVIGTTTMTLIIGILAMAGGTAYLIYHIVKTIKEAKK